MNTISHRELEPFLQTAPMPWGGIVFIMNTTPDEIGSIKLLRLPPAIRRRLISYEMCFNFKKIWQHSLLHSMIFTGNICKIV